MENSEYRVNASYHFESRLKGEVELTLFNDYFLHVQTKKLKRTSDFKLEVATLDPETEKVDKRAIHWLGAAVLCGLSAIAIAYLLVTDMELADISLSLLGILVCLVATLGFTFLYFYKSEHKWVIKTRHAAYPLVTLPFTSASRDEAASFLSQVQSAITSNVTKRRYTSDDLFAGEMRMLRRLAKHNILSMKLYDRAKAHMLKSHQAIPTG